MIFLIDFYCSPNLHYSYFEEKISSTFYSSHRKLKANIVLNYLRDPQSYKRKKFIPQKTRYLCCRIIHTRHPFRDLCLSCTFCTHIIIILVFVHMYLYSLSLSFTHVKPNQASSKLWNYVLLYQLHNHRTSKSFGARDKMINS